MHCKDDRINCAVQYKADYIPEGKSACDRFVCTCAFRNAYPSHKVIHTRSLSGDMELLISVRACRNTSALLKQHMEGKVPGGKCDEPRAHKIWDVNTLGDTGAVAFHTPLEEIVH